MVMGEGRHLQHTCFLFIMQWSMLIKSLNPFQISQTGFKCPYMIFSKNMVNGMKYGWPCATEVKMVLLDTVEIYCLLSLEKHSLQFQSLKKFKIINNNLRFNRCYLRENISQWQTRMGFRNPKRNFHGTWLSS